MQDDREDPVVKKQREEQNAIYGSAHIHLESPIIQPPVPRVVSQSSPPRETSPGRAETNPARGSLSAKKFLAQAVALAPQGLAKLDSKAGKTPAKTPAKTPSKTPAKSAANDDESPSRRASAILC